MHLWFHQAAGMIPVIGRRLPLRNGRV